MIMVIDKNGMLRCRYRVQKTDSIIGIGVEIL